MALSARLRAETRDLHDWIEARLDLGQDLSAARYRGLLERWFGFVEPFESRPAPQAAREWIEPAWRTHWLAEDLGAMGLSAAEIRALPRCPLAELNTTVPCVFGALYVLEGSALGGRIIAGWARRACGEALNAFRFFDGHGDQTLPRWRRFNAQMDARVSSASHGAAIDAARKTFTLLGHWLRCEAAAEQLAASADHFRPIA
jgi:heme oxygenase